VGVQVGVCYVRLDRAGLRNTVAVQKLQSLYLQCLYVYMKGQRPGITIYCC